jgi:hypothetical protein
MDHELLRMEKCADIIRLPGGSSGAATIILDGDKVESYMVYLR